MLFVLQDVIDIFLIFMLTFYLVLAVAQR